MELDGNLCIATHVVGMWLYIHRVLTHMECQWFTHLKKQAYVNWKWSSLCIGRNCISEQALAHMDVLNGNGLHSEEEDRL